MQLEEAREVVNALLAEFERGAQVLAEVVGQAESGPYVFGSPMTADPYEAQLCLIRRRMKALEVVLEASDAAP